MHKNGSYAEIAEIKSWHKVEVKVVKGAREEQNVLMIDKSSLKSKVEYLQRCLVGYFGNTTSIIPSRSEV